MKTRRIVLAHNSRLLQEMLRRVFNKTDGLQVVQEQIGLGDIDRILEHTHPDWLIISTDQAPGIVDVLVANHPSVRIITASTNGNPIHIRQANGNKVDLAGLSLSELLTILRDEKEICTQ